MKIVNKGVPQLILVRVSSEKDSLVRSFLLEENLQTKRRKNIPLYFLDKLKIWIRSNDTGRSETQNCVES